MIVNRTTRETSIFVMHIEDIERLIDSIKTEFPSFSFTAACSDNMTRTFVNLDELRVYPNPERAKISQLEIRAHDFQKQHSLNIQFDTDAYSNTNIAFTASEDAAIRISQAYTDTLDSMRPWYYRIAKSDWVIVIISIYFLFFISAVALITVKTGKSPVKPSDFLRLQFKEFIQIAVGLTIGVLVSKFQRRFFPGGVFALGDGKRRHEKTEIVRTVIIVGFAISVISTLLLSWA